VDREGEKKTKGGGGGRSVNRVGGLHGEVILKTGGNPRKGNYGGEEEAKKQVYK